MNESNLNETKKSGKQSGENENFSEVSNADMVNIYDMPNMTSGPSEVNVEEIRRLYGRSVINKGIYRK
ncbi:hypothetical protein KPL37_11635 [Clostridium frigoris]|uniref:Uncharacterized protein n=1 Tax=Clostridium frigoris TaxID=205327 RepID=A0ABS6BU09_9CLOT|nr:hypothetical protein [Clostridium frigoris]MBU3160397.1 hypothetical protein [Clostridium frigoris]